MGLPHTRFKLFLAVPCLLLSLMPIAAVLAVDTDHDGLSDAQELQAGTDPTKPDTDGGGVNDDWELARGFDPLDPTDDSQIPPDYDIDNDGVLNEHEGTNMLDADSDNDGLSDANEIGLVDADNDGFLDDLTDLNQNGMPDVAEPLTLTQLPDFDGDGIPNHLDVDSDNDGVWDKLEYNTSWVPQGYNRDPLDVDGDGMPNGLDTDSDGDGKFDFDEENIQYFRPISSVTINSTGFRNPSRDANGQVWQLADSDGDGIPNLADADNWDGADQDGDQIADRADIDIPPADGSFTSDADQDGIQFHFDWDANNDGALDTAIDNMSLNASADDSIPPIFDNDDATAYQPPDPNIDPSTIDTDRDSLSDAQEQQLGTNPLRADTDGGGVNDDWELVMGSDPLNMFDDAGVHPDYDIDNDGVLNELEGSVTNDADSDGDGYSDANEIGLIDADNDGYLDDLTDINLNGMPDVAEPLTGAPLPDFDGDGLANHLDADSDNDGIHDQLEYDTSWVPDGYSGDPLDVDGDGLPNGVDLDSDGDGIFDAIEELIHHLSLDDSRVGSYISVSITAQGQILQLNDDDGDGIENLADADGGIAGGDTDGDGIHDRADINNAAYYGETYSYWDAEFQMYYQTRDQRPNYDRDTDGIEDRYDMDIGNDGALDLSGGRTTFRVDADQDGIPAVYDDDDNTPYVAPVVTETETETETETNNSIAPDTTEPNAQNVTGSEPDNAQTENAQTENAQPDNTQPANSQPANSQPTSNENTVDAVSPPEQEPETTTPPETNTNTNTNTLANGVGDNQSNAGSDTTATVPAIGSANAGGGMFGFFQLMLLLLIAGIGPNWLRVPRLHNRVRITGK